MKRFIALLLAALMLCFALSSCRIYYSLFGIDETYTGQIVYAYLCDAPSTFDPLYAYLDESASFVMSLIYEGLYKYDSKGKVVEGLASGYKKTLWNKNTGEFQIEITIKKTMWNDQTDVSADQFVYAWRRILDPSMATAAAVLLYDIKNARKVANAEDGLTKFDFGATAVGANVLRIDLETEKLEDGSYREPDLNAFFAKLASPVLVPLRSDAVTKLEDWASTNATVLSCGPFFLKNFSPGDDSLGVMRFERNRYYLRDQELDPLDKYVKPYEVVVSLANRDGYYDQEDQKVKYDPASVRASAAIRALEKYENGDVDYLSYIPLESREKYSSVKTQESLFTHTYFFNTENPLFKDPKVRQALSLAIDRTELANILVYAEAADTIVSDKAFEKGYYTRKGASFNSKSGDHPYVPASANIEEAKKLLTGVTKGSFSITVKEGDEVSLRVAEYCRDVWKELGYRVTIRKLGIITYQQNAYDGRLDVFNACYAANGRDAVLDLSDKDVRGGLTAAQIGDKKLSEVKEVTIEGYDVIAVDFYQNSTDAFTVLAPFSKYFSGGSIDLSVSQEDEYVPVLPLTSYDNEEYNALIEKAFKAANASERAEALHAAEDVLMNDLPVMPLFSFRSPLVMIKQLSKITYGFGAEPNFINAKVKNYKDKESEQ